MDIPLLKRTPRFGHSMLGPIKQRRYAASQDEQSDIQIADRVLEEWREPVIQFQIEAVQLRAFSAHEMYLIGNDEERWAVAYGGPREER